MDKKYIWEENDIKFIDNDSEKKKIVYSSITTDCCPFAECSFNTSCEDKCSQAQEEAAYDLACKIYDNLSATISLDNDIFQKLKTIKDGFEQYVSSNSSESFVICLKIQLIHELQIQANQIIPNDLIVWFLK